MNKLMKKKTAKKLKGRDKDVRLTTAIAPESPIESTIESNKIDPS